MSFLTITANAMTKFLEEYLAANKEEKISPKDFAFMTIKGTEAKTSTSASETTESASEEVEEVEEEGSDSPDAKGKGTKEQVIILLNSSKTPKPHHGVIGPEHVMPKLISLMEKNGLGEAKKVGRKWNGAVFLVDKLNQVVKLLSKSFDVTQEEFADFEGPSWVKAKTAKPKGNATRGRPKKTTEEKPKGKGKTSKKAKSSEEEDEE